MDHEVFICRYQLSIPSSRVRMLLIMAILLAEMHAGQEVQERDGRYRLDEKERKLEIDASTGFGKTLARMFQVLIAELYVEGEYMISFCPTLTPESRGTGKASSLAEEGR